jgi:predicted phage terminase large subunit-like protein
VKKWEAEYFDGELRRSLASFITRSFLAVVPGQQYVHNWHIDAMAWHLEQCYRGAIKRLVISLPPRSLKSICTSVAFPAWVLGQDPTKRILCASYTESLASSLSLNCRDLMQSDWYRRIFPGARIGKERNSRLEFVTTRRGFRYATSVGGTLTGRGGNILIIDDPLSADDAMSATKRTAVNEWFAQTLYSRLDNKREGVIILVMQRLHEDDLAGFLLKRVGSSWTHLNLPAIATDEQRIQIGDGEFYNRAPGELLHADRDSHAELDDTKSQMGSFKFSAQYQQDPLPQDGEIIKWEWFRFYDSLPSFGSGGQVVQSWDTASKADELHDYSVCTTWFVQDNQYYLVDVLRQKLLYPDLKRVVIGHALGYSANAVLIEDKGSGISLIQDLRESGIVSPIPFRPEGDKIVRMSAQSPRIEAGQVHLPRRATWLDDFRDEVRQFPHGHDDQIDSLSQFLCWVQGRTGNRWAVQPIFVENPDIPGIRINW